VDGSSGAKSDVTVEGITFDAAGVNPVSSNNRGIFTAVNSTNVRIVNNKFLTSTGNITSGAAVFFSDAIGQVESNDVSNFEDQIEAYVSAFNSVPGSGSLTIAHNSVHDDAAGNAIYIHGNTSGNPLPYPVTVDGNYINNTPAQAGSTGSTGNSIDVYYVYGVRISGNYANTPAFSCYRMNSAVDIMITGNHCTNAGESAAYSEFASRHNQWVNNYFENAAGTCLALTNYSNTPPGYEHTAIGNHFQNCGTSGPSGGFYPAGIQAEGYAVVSGNIIDTVSGTGGGGTGIRIGYGGTGNTVLVKDNIVSGANVGIGVEATTGGAIVEGNQIAFTTYSIAGTTDGTSPGALPSGVTVRNQTMTSAYLGSADNGSFVYCTDCGSGGTGAFARRANGSWISF
jgi:hypothetical protein